MSEQEIGKKICSKCGIEKDLIDFYRDDRTIDRYRSQCKKCMNRFSSEKESIYKDTRRQYREENEEKVREIQRTKYIRNKEKILKNNAEYRSKPRYIFTRYRSSARRRDIEFRVDESYFNDIVINNICYYCGISLPLLGVDRKDSSIGYIDGNVVPCCSVCNRVKNIYNSDFFIKHIKKIYDYQNNKG